MKNLVLASTSPFRKMLLEKLNIPFICLSPNVDEQAYNNESAVALVERLAIAKAKAVASSFDDQQEYLIIGSDQVALSEQEILGKPHTVDNAIKQLSQFSGKVVTFYTGLAVYNSRTKECFSLVEPFNVHFNSLTLSDIKHYITAEQPLKCAGSFKSEGLGICLFSKLEGDDPNTLIGLPLIKLVSLLKKHDFDVLANQPTVNEC